MFGGLLGWAGGTAAAVAVWVVLGRTEDPAVVRRRERLLEDLPTGVDLLASCLDAGAAPESALVVVSRALGGPVGEEFLAVHHRLEVGVDPRQVWRSVAGHPELGPLGRAVGRAHQTGAPSGGRCTSWPTSCASGPGPRSETRARSIEVKAAAPLGVCLLPAFVVLGVVPMVAGVFGAMRLFMVTSTRPQAVAVAGFSTAREVVIAPGARVEKPRPVNTSIPASPGPGQQSGEVMSHTALALVRDEASEQTVETDRPEPTGPGTRSGPRRRSTPPSPAAAWASPPSCSSSSPATAGQGLLKLIFNAIKALLPF